MPASGPALSLKFFFSSRRRHTSCLSDWSSDVCSSDLSPRDAGPLSILLLDLWNTPVSDQAYARKQTIEFLKGLPAGRSEERRVGKECRESWCGYAERE